MRWATLLVVLCVSLSGCRRPRWDNPVDAYLSFSRALQEGNFSLAYSALSKDTQERLSGRVEAISRATDGGIRPEPAQILFRNPSLAAPVTAVTLLKDEGSVAMLNVTVGSVAHPLKMVKEQAGWKVDLSEQLTP